MLDYVIVAIDPSSAKLSACISDVEGTFVQMEIKRLSKDWKLRCQQADEWAHGLVYTATNLGSEFSQVMVVIEKPIVWGSKTSTIVLGQISGALIAGAARAKPDLMELANVSTWKATVVGNGRADKPEIARHLHQYWPDAWKAAKTDKDLIDAACINRYGCVLVRRAEAFAKTKKRRLVTRTR